MKANRSALLAFGIFVVASLLLFGRTLSYPFLFDDYPYLLENPLIVQWHSFSYFNHFHEFANESIRLGHDPDISVNFILRPFGYLTFYLNYFFGGWQPEGFRFVNIVIHGLNAGLIWSLLRFWIRSSPKHLSNRGASAQFIPAVCATLFLAHPMAMESVTYIVQRFTSLGTFFYLVVLNAHFRSAAAPGRGSRWMWIGLSFGAMLLGIQTKEILFTVPFLIVATDHFMMGSPVKAALRRAAYLFVLLPLIPTLMWLTSSALNDGGMKIPSAIFVASPLHQANFQLHYAMTEPAVILNYLRLIAVPYGLNLDPDFPVLTSFGDWRVFGAIAAIVALFVTSAWLYRRRTNDLHRTLFFCGTIWFFLTLGIDSSVVPLPDVMAEHRAYLPSIGALLVFAVALDQLRQRWQNSPEFRWIVPTATGGWVAALVIGLVIRQEAWSSDILMWTDVTSKSPEKARPWMNLGAGYYRERQLKDAFRCFTEFHRLEPKSVAGYVNLATVNLAMGNTTAALQTASMGVQQGHSPYDADLYYVLGKSWLAAGDVDRSIECSELVIKALPSYAEAHRTLMVLYSSKANYQQALNHARIASSLLPKDKSLATNVQQLSQVLAMQGNH